MINTDLVYTSKRVVLTHDGRIVLAGPNKLWAPVGTFSKKSDGFGYSANVKRNPTEAAATFIARSRKALKENVASIHNWHAE